MFKNLVLYRITAGWPQTIGQIDDGLRAQQFTPCGPTMDKSVGWVEPRGQAHGSLVESIGGHQILKLMIKTKSVPGEVVRAKAQEAAEQIEQSTGRKPGKRELRELREDALLALLPMAFARQSACTVWIDPATRLLAIDAASQSRADDVATALVRSIDGLQLGLVNTQTSPQAAMTAWLSAQTPEEWPASLSVERECVLKSQGEDKSVVRYTRHNLAGDQIREHIAQGKLPTHLALSWDGRLSFVLTETLQLKKIEFLDGVFEKTSAQNEDGFDADVAIATGELSRLLPQLIEALGDELALGQSQEDTSGAAPPAEVVAPGTAPTPAWDGVEPDPLLEQAVACVRESDRETISTIQRRLRIGFHRASRLLEAMERLGVVTPASDEGQRDVVRGYVAA